jgi:tripartite-type tricarboxylate transporter receptor subunit TctC
MIANLQRLARAIFLIGLIAALPSAAIGQSVEQFYRGRTMTLVVGTSPGGINDISSRLVARHLGHFIPGNPNIIVRTCRAAAASSPQTASSMPRNGTDR